MEVATERASVGKFQFYFLILDFWSFSLCNFVDPPRAALRGICPNRSHIVKLKIKRKSVHIVWGSGPSSFIGSSSSSSSTILLSDIIWRTFTTTKKRKRNCQFSGSFSHSDMLTNSSLWFGSQTWVCHTIKDFPGEVRSGPFGHHLSSSTDHPIQKVWIKANEWFNLDLTRMVASGDWLLALARTTGAGSPRWTRWPPASSPGRWTGGGSFKGIIELYKRL